MAKRAPIDQKPFTALDKGLAASVLNPTPVVQPTPVAETQEPFRVTPVEVDSRPAAVIRELPLEAHRTASTPRISPPVARQPKVSREQSYEKLSREKRVLLTLSEEREVERCVDRIAEGFGGTPVKLSHLVRACLTVMRHAEKEIIHRAEEVGELTRPPNGDVMAIVEFEHELAKVLSQAFRDAPVLR